MAVHKNEYLQLQKQLELQKERLECGSRGAERYAATSKWLRLKWLKRVMLLSRLIKATFLFGWSIIRAVLEKATDGLQTKKKSVQNQNLSSMAGVTTTPASMNLGDLTARPPGELIMMESGRSVGGGRFFIVPDRKRNTLPDIIKRNCAPESSSLPMNGVVTLGYSMTSLRTIPWIIQSSLLILSKELIHKESNAVG